METHSHSHSHPGPSRPSTFYRRAECAVAGEPPCWQAGRLSALPFALGLALLAPGCSGTLESEQEPIPPLGNSAQQLTAPSCNLDSDRSLVVHDAATLVQGDFSLERTLEQIADTSGGRITSPAALLQSLIDGFNLQSGAQQGGLRVPLDVRQGEAGLRAEDLLNPRHVDFMEPVALFNRFDLMPHNGAHCGEHRIVYAKTNATGGRFFLIFEAALPNPEGTLAGCQKVADFWASLSDDQSFPSAIHRARALEDFYYEGLPGFDPVVSHQNYGVPFGQVRSNHFIDRVTWQLREWRASFGRAGTAAFAPATDKQTPLAELYDSRFVPPPGSPLSSPVGAFERQRAAFQADFLTNQVKLLAAPEAAGRAAFPEDIVVGFASGFPERFNDFQSNAQGNADVPAVLARSGFAADVAQAAPPFVSATQLLNRAGSQTCGGCHQFSNNQDIGTLRGGTTVRWPRSLGFVHVDESGRLSDALQDFFLPARLSILEEVCEQSVGGEEPEEPGSCGGPSGDRCEADQFCTSCGGGGECQERPRFCPDEAPVCGCDGVTYRSECHAQRAGVAAVKSGACESAGQQCQEKAPRGCCFEDSQCGSAQCAGAECAPGGAGVCVPALRAGACWQDSDCGTGLQCEGERICPCGVACFAPDSPGRCVAETSGCDEMVAQGAGLSLRRLGFRWTGDACEGVVGSRCEGADCQDLFATASDCAKAHAGCGSAPPRRGGTVTPRQSTPAEQPAADPVPSQVSQAVAEFRRASIAAQTSRNAPEAAAEELLSAAGRLQAAVLTARRAERAEPGAFVEVRRVH